MLLVKNAIAPSLHPPLRIHTSLSPNMTIPDLLRLLLLLLLGLLAVIGGLLPSAFDKQNSLCGKCFIFGLGVLCGVLALVGGGFITTAQAEQNADWIQKVCWTLGFGYVFALPTTLYLLRSRQGNNAETSSNTPEAISQRWRQELLASMLREVTVRMKDSLHDDELIPLLMEDQREKIGRPPEEPVNAKPSPDWWEKLRKFIRVTAEFEPGKKIIDVFKQDDIDGRLLILGAPGSGKTTMLLELAQDLILAAQQQPEKPIPVIFELSAWKDDKQPIVDWLVADLKFRNNIPEAVSREWLETGKLLLLLDGLDELQSRQGNCIEKINEFLQTTSGLSQIVVCCREEEYKAGEEILTLQGAVCLKPLEKKQIKSYLQRLKCGHLWQGIQSDPNGLLELAKMPLFLHLIPVAYPNGLESKAKRFNSPAELEAYHEKCRKDLFDAYIKRRLELPHDYQGYNPKDSKRWLIWLAKTLKEQKQTEFIIEETQQDFLDNHKQKLVSGLLIIGLISVLRLEITSMIFPLLMIDLFKSDIDINILDQKLTFWLLETEGTNKSKSNTKAKNPLINFIVFILVALPLVMLIEAVLLLAKGQLIKPISLVISGLDIVLIWSISSASLPVIQYFVSRLILWEIGAIPWNYARFLSYANERRLIKRVGGRYRFIHDLLREHFAKM
ncbi:MULTISPECIES: NACHT domain-containing protein [Cyanophyceae]|uniref:NACHT domain-containing protein n=1 Tax=Cyanophyceae TaxID=3028117 RepID=UPI001689EA8E|nr:NACHT domain-containing protein [Trichocoleus sp. FACHB-69]MBD1930843.1 NACHT domain-containing protein [Trichocoleus sp. FACHB-69]